MLPIHESESHESESQFSCSFMMMDKHSKISVDRYVDVEELSYLADTLDSRTAIMTRNLMDKCSIEGKIVDHERISPLSPIDPTTLQKNIEENERSECYCQLITFLYVVDLEKFTFTIVELHDIQNKLIHDYLDTLDWTDGIHCKKR